MSRFLHAASSEATPAHSLARDPSWATTGNPTRLVVESEERCELTANPRRCGLRMIGAGIPYTSREGFLTLKPQTPKPSNFRPVCKHAVPTRTLQPP